MSISLSNHDTRIAALENKVNSIPAGGGVAESFVGNPGYIQFSNGLIVNFGSGHTGGVGFVYVAFKKPFTTKAVAICNGVLRGSGMGDYRSIGGFDLKGARIAVDNSSNSYYIAIGYLISDRILNYAYACKSLLFTPLRTMEV